MTPQNQEKHSGKVKKQNSSDMPPPAGNAVNYNCCCISRSVDPLRPMDCSPPGSSVHGISQQEYWSGLPFPPPGDLPNPGIEPGSPVLEVDSLPPEPPKSWLTMICFLVFFLWFVLNVSKSGTSLVVQRLTVCASSVAGEGLIPGRGTKITHVSRCGGGEKEKIRKLFSTFIFLLVF